MRKSVEIKKEVKDKIEGEIQMGEKVLERVTSTTEIDKDGKLTTEFRNNHATKFPITEIL